MHNNTSNKKLEIYVSSKIKLNALFKALFLQHSSFSSFGDLKAYSFLAIENAMERRVTIKKKKSFYKERANKMHKQKADFKVFVHLYFFQKRGGGWVWVHVR